MEHRLGLGLLLSDTDKAPSLFRGLVFGVTYYRV